jgi:hypothetical protein
MRAMMAFSRIMDAQVLALSPPAIRGWASPTASPSNC